MDRIKALVIFSLFNIAIGCSSDKHKVNPVTSVTDTRSTFDSSKYELSDKKGTISFSYAAIACGCPQWYETKFSDVEYLEGVERFYLEPVNKDLIKADTLWDGRHLPLTVKVTGRFTREKEDPVTYHPKDEREKARIFWYEKISVVSPTSN